MRAPRFVAIVVSCISLFGLFATGASAGAPVRVDDPNVPFYGRVLNGEEWSAVIFYRPPACVPLDFNIEGFFAGPSAFSCAPMTVSGFAIYENGPPPIDPGPKQARWINARDVPIWFVPTAAYNRLNADGRVTIAELVTLDPLVGSATFFTEVLHLRPPSPAFQHYSVVARGALEDGREFFLRILRTPGERHFELRLSA
jgi:hypothetical protein